VPHLSLDDLPEAAVLVDADGGVVASNALSRSLVAPPLLDVRSALEALPDDATTTARIEMRRDTGVPVLIDVSIGAVRDGLRLCLLRELGADRLVGEAQRHFDAAFDGSRVGMAVFNPDGEYVRVNDALCAMLGRRREELIGHRDSELTHPDDRDMVADSAWRILRGEARAASHEQRFVRPDGTIVTVLAHATFLRDADDRPLSWVCQFVDITARREAEDASRRQQAELTLLARHDALTGLLNRRALEERLAGEAARAQRHAQPLSLVLLDIDEFKAINDVHGHPAGDRVLAEVGRRLEALARTGEPVARVGGEEFAWLLPSTTALGAFAAAERARRAVEDVPFDEVGHVTLSAGVCDLEEAGDAQELYRLADVALYWAKAHGSNLVFRYAAAAALELSAATAERVGDQDRRLGALRTMSRTVEAELPATIGHAERVAALAHRLASALEWGRTRTELLREAALVHDVGKVAIPRTLLAKTEPLTDEEFDRVRTHAAIGAEMVGSVLHAEQVAWVRHHHERWDGGGYPDRLSGGSIPEGAAIIAVADAYDAMTSARGYGPTLDPAEALTEILAEAGRQFSPGIAQAFVRVLSADDTYRRSTAPSLFSVRGDAAAPR